MKIIVRKQILFHWKNLSINTSFSSSLLLSSWNLLMSHLGQQFRPGHLWKFRVSWKASCFPSLFICPNDEGVNSICIRSLGNPRLGQEWCVFHMEIEVRSFVTLCDYSGSLGNTLTHVMDQKMIHDIALFSPTLTKKINHSLIFLILLFLVLIMLLTVSFISLLFPTPSFIPLFFPSFFLNLCLSSSSLNCPEYLK